MNFIKILIVTLLVLSISNVSLGKIPKFYSVVECLMTTMKNKNLTGNRMFEVVHKECERKINVTKTDIIEHKGELVRKYLEKREIGSFDQNKDMSFMILPSKDGL